MYHRFFFFFFLLGNLGQHSLTIVYLEKCTEVGRNHIPYNHEISDDF